MGAPVNQCGDTARESTRISGTQVWGNLFHDIHGLVLLSSFFSILCHAYTVINVEHVDPTSLTSSPSETSVTKNVKYKSYSFQNIFEHHVRYVLWLVEDMRALTIGSSVDFKQFLIGYNQKSGVPAMATIYRIIDAIEALVREQILESMEGPVFFFWQYCCILFSLSYTKEHWLYAPILFKGRVRICGNSDFRGSVCSQTSGQVRRKFHTSV